jgi:TonB family protein
MVDSGHTYFEFQVEKKVEPMPNSSLPVYPETPHAANVHGEVLVQLAVHTAGHADMSTFKVLKATHPWFTAAVRDAVTATVFSSATVGGRKVRQLVQMPYRFRRERF